ncbi:MAG: TraR/DksA C4-type zinc finger protein [Deltaproteobacteria bacterium]|nr:TraR/DksA C4-type zinc finger protein [Deltaproteobacteria bacterium]
MDRFDWASEIETQEREAAIARARENGSAEIPLVIAGVRCCRDCEEPIPAGRLRVRPDAVRCVSCQERHERRLQDAG